jgi:PAS domain S-box-containing protein
MAVSHRKNWHRTASVRADDDRFRVVLDAVKDGIFILDPATGRFIEANRPGLVMFGYSMDELIGGDIGLLSSGTPPYTQETALENCKRAALGEAQNFEWQCKVKGGTLFWAEISINPVKIGDQRCIVATIHDISERKRLDKKLSLAMQKVQAASDAKSAFLATMSHELRTPLNAVIGFADLMLGETLGPVGHPRYSEYLGDIRKSGEHLLALINQVLDLARLDSGKAPLAEEDVYLPYLLEDVCRTIEPLAQEADLHIVTDIPVSLPSLRGDTRRLRQILLNLLSNAVKFTPPHGTITIDAAETAKGLVLHIRDTGIGIAEADLPVVLERFGQNDSMISRKHEGTGLGLPLAKQLAELHGGSLVLESEEGAGTCITVTFPAERIIRPEAKAVA